MNRKIHSLKQTLACLIVIVMTLTAVPLGGFVGLELPKWSQLFATKASATDTYTEGNLKYEVENGEATITYCNRSISGELIIPDTLGGFPVTGIGDYAFENCENLTSVVIPDGVMNIGYSAFNECEDLTNVTIGNSVELIGDYAFYYCRSLVSIVIPDNVTSIGVSAFGWCSNLTNVTIGNGVTSIGSCAFESCSNLKTINVSKNNSAYSSDNGVLYNKNKTEIIRYPEGIENNTYVIIDSVNRIGDYAFSDCSKLTNITIPNNVTSIGDHAFSLCFNLKNIVIPENVESIDMCAFYGCQNITSVVIPDSVNYIGDFAFGSCSELINITIGNNVDYIGYDTFVFCSKLEEIKVSQSNATYSSEDGILFNKDKTELIQYPNGKTDKEYTIPDGVTSVGYGAFKHANNLTSIQISCSVSNIGIGAFEDCKNLTSVTIPDNVTKIGNYAFEYCTGLTSITIDNSVTSIGGGAFYNCSNLQDVYYAGTEEQWKSISIDWGNDCLTNATIHFNYDPTHVHSYASSITKAATCTESGTVTYSCNCGASYTGTISALGHSFTNYVSDNNATCTKDGTKTAKCDHCNGTDTVTDQGSMLAHNESSWIIDKAPTCTEPGSKHTVCSVCGITMSTQDIEATGHDYVTYVTYPTCSSDGYTSHICSVCGNNYQDNFVKQIGHHDDNNDGLCDDCEKVMEEHDPSENCTCMCHKTGFMQFIYKIVRIFWILFGTNKTCNCGVAHY